MLTAFALVIVLGIGGMSLFFALAVANFEHQRAAWAGEEQRVLRQEAERLSSFYARRGSWAEVGPEFSRIERALRDRPFAAVTLLNERGRVVASPRAELESSGDPFGTLPPSPPAAPAAPGIPDAVSLEEEIRAAERERSTVAVQQVLPIEVEGRQVGALLVAIDGRAMMAQGGGFFDRSRFGQGVASAALALAAVLLGLAAFFSRRLSTPLRQLTGASRALAAGEMGVRVRPPAVRELAELAGAFNGMADALVRADEQRRQLTADVAHELRTPLAIIKGRLEGIEDGVYRADDEQISGLLGEVALLERLIEDLRLLALADAGQLPLYPEAVDPAHLLADARRSFAQQAAERGVALSAEAAPGLPELSADPQRIAQVLGNLMGNALRHTPGGGCVTLSAALQPAGGAQGAAVLFEVRDSGAGIPPEDLPHIFDRFYRADRARSRSSGGAGLGLAIARRIIEAHGGRIWAESAPGSGTAMRFSLPVG